MGIFSFDSARKRVVFRPFHSEGSSPDVRIAIATIQKRVEESRRPEDVAALGVAYLAVANADKAVTALEESTDRATPDPNGLSDLAAAYLVRGAEQNQSQDVAKALSAAERANDYGFLFQSSYALIRAGW
jgi:predicted Zn-dependent protease